MKVSIIVPTLNAEKHFPAFKEALEKQTMQAFEIVIMDSKSRDKTTQLFEEMGARVFSVDNFQHGRVRNEGASHAAGEILVFMTQDALPQNEAWLENLIKPICRGQAAASFARQVPYKDASPLEQFARATNYPEESRIVSQEDIQTLGPRAFFFSNSCSAIKKDIFEHLGGFTSQTIMNEDMLFASRLLKQGGKIAYTADAVVTHSHNYTIWRTFQRYFDIGVVMKQAEPDLAAAPLSKEGLSYVIRLFKFLLSNKHFAFIPQAFWESAAKWIGFRLGKLYAFYPQSVLKQVSMHGNYWNQNRWFFSLSNQLLTPLTLMASDVLIVLICMMIAFSTRATFLANLGLEPFAPAINYFSLWPALLLLLVLRLTFGLYPGYAINEADELRRQTIASSLVLFFILSGGTLFGFNEYYSRAVLILASLLLLIALPVARAGVKFLLAKTSFYGSPIWIVGESPRAFEFKDVLENNPVMGLKVIGHSKHPPEDAYAPHCLVVPDDLEGSLGKLLDRLHRQFKNVMIAPSLLDTATAWVTPRDLKGHLTLELKNMLLEPKNELLKRSFDFLLASFSLIVFAPLFGVLAIMIRLTSEGPAVFKQERVGRYGKKFQTYKFRTMRKDAEELLESYLANNEEAKEEWMKTQKLKRDPRITGLGRFLRLSSIDELPQLLNIWKGDMSFVGPRPVIEAELERYGDKVHLYQQATPGLTGLTQVSGRSDVSYEERVQLDTYYARNWSIWLDLVIIAKTVVAVISRKGAY